jgi:hypothetical protein
MMPAPKSAIRLVRIRFWGIVLLPAALLPVYAGAYGYDLHPFFISLSLSFATCRRGMVSLTETAFFGMTATSSDYWGTSDGALSSRHYLHGAVLLAATSE